jgi:hypothetical protein
MRTASKSPLLHGGCAMTTICTALGGAPIVSRNSAFTRSTFEVVRMFPLKPIFPLGSTIKSRGELELASCKRRVLNKACWQSIQRSDVVIHFCTPVQVTIGPS